MTTLLLLLLLLLAPAAAASPPHGTHVAPRSQAALTREAEALVASVEAGSSPLPQDLLHAFDDPRRRTVDYLPLQMRQDQRGLRLGGMTLEQRRHTHALLREVLSEEGYLRFMAIRSLEDVLRASATRLVGIRDREAYTVQLFGRPSLEAPWAFKLEGHHVSVNATLVDGRFRGTPLFLGANPAEVRTGSDAGLRVLGPQESLARALLASLGDEQRAEALEPEFLPGATIPVGALGEPGAPAGLSAARMTPAQRELLVALVASFAANLRADFAAEELERLEQAGIEQLRFLWRGATEPGGEFSYLVVGPTVALQLDAIDDSPGSGANHLHSLWRDPERDFGADLLLRHYAEEHEQRR